MAARAVDLNTDRDTRRLREGAADLGVHLNDAQLEQFRTYHDALTDWNSRVNLTAITGWDDVVDRHYLDSLTARLALPPEMVEGGRFVDIGTGAGLPGVALKIAFPGLGAALVDATGKKAAFLEHLVRRLGLRGADVLAGRAETLGHNAELRESFDFVVARAVSGMATLAELTLPFCRLGGRVIAYKTRSAEDEVLEAENAIATMGGTLSELVAARVPGIDDDRLLVVMKKTAHSPDKYPRRPGLPGKRPVTSSGPADGQA